MLLLAILLLLAAVGLLVAALLTGQTALAWGSVGLSAVVVLILVALRRRVRRRRRKQAEADPDDEHDTAQDPLIRHDAVQDEADPDEADPDEADPDEADPDEAERASPQPREPSAETIAEPAAPAESAEPAVGAEAAGVGESGDDTEPDEEDTDAADLLVVWELPDEVLVVDEHPRYHLARCTWPDAAATERLPVQEARELGFTPCAQCRPDASLARKRRAAIAKQDGAKQDGAKQGGAKQDGAKQDKEVTQETDQGASSGGQDSDNSAVLG